MNEEKEESEFGKGLAYNLGLFMAHQFKWREEDRKRTGFAFWPERWFNEASDHCYDLQVDSAPKPLHPRLKEFRDKCLHWGHGLSEAKATPEDVYWAISEAKALLLELDKAHGIPAVKAQWD